MGGVAVLQPQDLLNNHYRNNPLLNRRNLSPTAMKSGPAVARSANRPKRSPPRRTPAPPRDKRTTRAPLKERNTNHKNTSKPTSDLVMGQVKILKRGEVLPASSCSAGKVNGSLKEVNKKEKKVLKVGAATTGGLDDPVVLSSTDVLGPEPDEVSMNIRISDFYAGSAFFTSPEPSSLPVPVFYKKKDVLFVEDDASSTDYDATSDLRRLLRLDLS